MSLSIQEFRSLHKLVDAIYAEANDLDMSYAQLAVKSGLSYPTVYNLGTYTTMYPRAATVLQLAKAVGLEVTLSRVQGKRRFKVA